MSGREWTAKELFDATLTASGRTPEVSGLAYSRGYVRTVAHDVAAALGLKIRPELPELPRRIAIRTEKPRESVVIMDAATLLPVAGAGLAGEVGGLRREATERERDARPGSEEKGE